MGDIMRASFYRFSRTRDLTYALLISLILGLTMGFMVLVQGEGLISDIEGSIDNWTFFTFFIVIVFTTVYIGGDFKSKVIYYELMSGHARWEVVLGRLIPCLALSILILTVGLGSIFSFGIKCSGWLDWLGGIGSVLGRYCLLMLNTIPFVVLCIIIAFLTKSFINSIAIAWLVWMLLQVPVIFEGDGGYVGYAYLKQYLLIPHMRQIMTMPLNLSVYAIGILMCIVKSGLIIGVGIALFQKSELK